VTGVLWSGPDRTRGWPAEVTSPVRGALQEKVLGLAGPSLSGHELHLPPGAPFPEPGRRVVDWTTDLSADEPVGLAGTFSTVIRLPESERRAVLDLVEEVVRTHPALAGRDRIEVPMVCTCRRTVRSGAGSP